MRAGGWPAACGPVLMAVLCTACTPLMRSTADTLRLAAHGQRTPEPSAAEVAAKPYFQLWVNAGKADALMILGNVDHGREAWYDASNGIVFLRDGVLVKTSGFPANVVATEVAADSPFRRGLQTLQGPTTDTRVLDLSPGYRFGVRLDAVLRPTGVETVTILGTPHRLLRVDEHVAAPALGFAADNHYWVDPADGFVWKSQQTLPGLPTITLTELRPYRKKAGGS